MSSRLDQFKKSDLSQQIALDLLPLDQQNTLINAANSVKPQSDLITGILLLPPNVLNSDPSLNNARRNLTRIQQAVFLAGGDEPYSPYSCLTCPPLIF